MRLFWPREVADSQIGVRLIDILIRLSMGSSNRFLRACHPLFFAFAIFSVFLAVAVLSCSKCFDDANVWRRRKEQQLQWLGDQKPKELREDLGRRGQSSHVAHRLGNRKCGNRADGMKGEGIWE